MGLVGLDLLQCGRREDFSSNKAVEGYGSQVHVCSQVRPHSVRVLSGCKVDHTVHTYSKSCDDPSIDCIYTRKLVFKTPKKHITALVQKTVYIILTASYIPRKRLLPLIALAISRGDSAPLSEGIGLVLCVQVMLSRSIL